MDDGLTLVLYAEQVRFVPMKNYLVIVFLIGWSQVTMAQEEKCNCPGQHKSGKGTFYFAGGYNLDAFTKSNIRFIDKTGPFFDFTIYHVKAEDRPGLKNIFHENITIPQYSFRFGYYFNDKHNLGIEINYDHAKYVMIDNQSLHVTGYMNGNYVDKDTLVSPEWLTYEHTNGANFCLVNLIKRIYIINSADKMHWLSGIVKPGIGFVLPRTDVTIFGVRRNDTYHVAGYIIGLDMGLRYDLFRYFFVETSAKSVFANYDRVFLPGDGRAKQKFFAFEYILTTGIQFGW